MSAEPADTDLVALLQARDAQRRAAARERAAAARERATRNRAIVDQVVAGDSMSTVAARFNLSRQRVHQIVSTAHPEFDARKRLEERRAARARAAGAARAAQRREAAERAARRRLTASHVHRVGDRQRYTDEEMLDALRAYAAEHGGTPTSLAWRRGGYAPSWASYTKRFGGWNAACEAAGLVPTTSRRTWYTRRSDEDLLSYVEAFLADEPYSSLDGRGASMYARWAAEHDGAPSLSLIRIRFDGWAAAKEKALTRMGLRP